MSLAYFPLYADDFEADTAHLTLAEDGAYNRLLRLCWRTPGCSIPADRNWIYRRMRATSEEDRAVVDIILDEFFVVAEGRCSNARLTKEWLAAKEAHERRKTAGSKGGSAKSLKSKASPSSNAKAKPKQPEPEPEPEPDIRGSGLTTTTTSAREEPEILPQDRGGGGSPPDTRRESLLRAMGIDPSAMTPAGRIPGNRADMAAADAWATDLGLTIDQQIEVIREVMAQKRDGPPKTFSYFTPAMRREAGRLASQTPLTPDTTPDTRTSHGRRKTTGAEIAERAAAIALSRRRP